ncbi:MAG TPA: ABC transporter ATP-binding protein [Anaerolineae bacterium]|nr:ABC transporter ATP-binding protein [Anaerolineae bacterium]
MSHLVIDKLSAGYGKLVVLHDVSLAVEPGQFVALVGPNGSGKSTLVKSVFGLTDIFSGTITFDDTSLIGLSTEAISRRGLAYVPQTRNVFTTMTIRENLQIAARRLKGNDAEQALRDVFEMFPILRERAGQGAGRMSGGERQMLAIALAWLARPRIMLLDEPSAGLAPLLVTEIFRQLRALCQRGVTLVVVEQNARSVLRACDYGYVMREGQIVFQGSSSEILADEETAKNYLGVAGKA